MWFRVKIFCTIVKLGQTPRFEITPCIFIVNSRQTVKFVCIYVVRQSGLENRFEIAVHSRYVEITEFGYVGHYCWWGWKLSHVKHLLYKSRCRVEKLTEIVNRLFGEVAD